MEVLEEEELKTIDQQQKHYAELRHAAALETQRLENEEQQRLAEIVHSKILFVSRIGKKESAETGGEGRPSGGTQEADWQDPLEGIPETA